MSKRINYVVHRGTGTIIAMEEAEIISIDTELHPDFDPADEEAILARTGQSIDDPYLAIWFTGEAVRQHFSEWDESDVIDGLTPEELDEAGEWALHGYEWDGFDDLLRYGVEQVKAEKAAKKSAPTD